MLKFTKYGRKSASGSFSVDTGKVSGGNTLMSSDIPKPNSFNSSVRTTFGEYSPEDVCMDNLQMKNTRVTKTRQHNMSPSSTNMKFMNLLDGNASQNKDSKMLNSSNTVMLHGLNNKLSFCRVAAGDELMQLDSEIKKKRVSKRVTFGGATIVDGLETSKFYDQPRRSCLSTGSLPNPLRSCLSTTSLPNPRRCCLSTASLPSTRRSCLPGSKSGQAVSTCETISVYDDDYFPKVLPLNNFFSQKR